MSMPNKSRFIAALELIDNAKAKLATMDTIYHRAPIVDPLDNPDLGPDRTSTRSMRGSNIGKLVGTLGGAALGGIAGHMAGGDFAGGAHDIGDAFSRLSPWYDGSQAHEAHDSWESAGAAHGGLVGALGGGLAGHQLGGHIGAGLGRITSTPEQQAAEKIRGMDPATGLAHIRMMEQSGHLSPSVIQAMKDAYNTRRMGVETQLGAGVAIPPGRAPKHTQPTRPEALPV